MRRKGSGRGQREERYEGEEGKVEGLVGKKWREHEREGVEEGCQRRWPF